MDHWDNLQEQYPNALLLHEDENEVLFYEDLKGEWLECRRSGCKFLLKKLTEGQSDDYDPDKIDALNDSIEIYGELTAPNWELAEKFSQYVKQFYIADSEYSKGRIYPRFVNMPPVTRLGSDIIISYDRLVSLNPSEIRNSCGYLPETKHNYLYRGFGHCSHFSFRNEQDAILFQVQFG